MKRILNILEREMKAVIHNWKTTLTGLIMLVSLWMFWNKHIDTQDFVSVIAAVAAAGLFISKDSTKV